MEGGCLDIWITEDLDFKSKWRLIQYAEILSKEFVEFSLDIQPAKFPENHLKTHFKQQIGQIPELMITICGFADPIFITAEHILNEHEGWLRIGISESEEKLKKFEGKAIRLIDDNDTGNDATYLVDGELIYWVYISQYFYTLLYTEFIRNFSNRLELLMDNLDY
ncbi:unnamed protein product [marine sediment metagenome]|uniref:Uncharacterized protein n=1 Tax=marine sediment metagenome TaxID=412755 RepID=X1LXY7_9ZZZZ